MWPRRANPFGISSFFIQARSDERIAATQASR
jgi:hypothetical protein